MKEHLPACVLKFFKKILDIKTTATTNTSLVAEHLLNDKNCARKYKIPRFEIIYHCKNLFYLVKIETISMFM